MGLPALALSDLPGRQRIGAIRVKPSQVDELGLGELAAGMRSGRFSAVSLTKDYLTRIEEIDRRGPALRSVIETNPDALAIARDLDRERKAGRNRGPLHGIPVLIKDNIDTHDRMTTTAGSLALAESIAAKDAFVVGKLREAGAVILGKTNLSEWANFRSTRSTSGWSGRGGLTRNPYALDRNASGSSSGSAAAVAANLCAVAVGTETDGSILSPSSVLRHCRHQTDAWAGQPVGDHSARAQPGHGGSDGADGNRCGDSPGMLAGPDAGMPLPRPVPEIRTRTTRRFWIETACAAHEWAWPANFLAVTRAGRS